MNAIPTAHAATENSQYLTFMLGQEEYGVEILMVQEIRGYTAVTPVPNTPNYVKGVMNLRGTIVPVVDLRAKLGLAEIEKNRFTVIVVVKVGAKVAGLIVDAVSDVLDLQQSEIQASPELGVQDDARYARGIARVKEKLVVLLDLEKLFGQGDLGGPALAA
ncbi:MAG: purine-binding chemotaxis protein CheW [Planctomycetes bacterium]|nr:purine-binding chemotaxis protein CheW [Planctomycetota bacterium]